METHSNLQMKRVYDEPASSDGFRALVDRLWPRGVSKDDAALDLWFKEIAPSPDLRKWFGHQRENFEEFSQRYHAELDINLAVTTLEELLETNGTVTLVYGAKDPQINHVAVLLDYMAQRSTGISI